MKPLSPSILGYYCIRGEIMKKIILIEDKNILKLRLKNAFQSNYIDNFETLAAKYVNATYLSKYKEEIGLYIFDIDTNTEEHFKKFQVIRSISQTPIIALSQSADPAILKKAVASGCNDFIIKPFSNDTLIYRVKKSIDSSSTPVVTEQPETFEEVSIQSTQMLWNKDYLIDVTEIDQEHAQIVEKYNELYTLMREGKGHEYYAELLAFLKSYVHEHFAHEEQLHEKHNYPLIHEHKNIHEGFKRTLTKIYENSSEKASDKELIRISLFIKQWLVHHILIEDKKFGDHIKNAP